MARKWIGFTAIMLGMSASALMQTIVATSMPTIVAEMGDAARYSWVFAAYMLASTITIPLFAGVADNFGRRRVYRVGILIFLTGSVLCGLARSFEQLIACRALQGIGAGAVAPAALAALGDLFEQRERGRVFGIIGAVQVLANLVGPPLGGWITDSFSWRWGFFLVAPLGIAAWMAASAGLPGRTDRSASVKPAMDGLGALLFAAGLSTLLLGLQWIGVDHGLSWPSGALCLSGIAILFGTLRWEKSHPHPVIPLALWRNRALRFCFWGTLLLGAATNCAVVYFPLYLQTLHGLSASSIGVALLPLLLAAGVASAAGGALVHRHPRWTPVGAWALVIAGFAFMAVVPLRNMVAVGLLIGTGLGALLPVYLLIAQQTGGPAHLAAASGLIQMARNLGGATGIPLIGIWLVGGRLDPAVFSAIFASLALLGGIGLILALWLSKDSAADRTDTPATDAPAN